jgi:hypothetical protein
VVHSLHDIDDEDDDIVEYRESTRNLLHPPFPGYHLTRALFDEILMRTGTEGRSGIVITTSGWENMLLLFGPEVCKRKW